MATDFDQVPEDSFPSPVDIAVTTFSDRLAQGSIVGPPDEWWMDWAVTESNAKLITKFYIPLQAFKMEPWKGHHRYKQGSFVTLSLRRKKTQAGAFADADVIVEKDLAAFKRSPELLALAGNKNLGKLFGALLTSALTTTAWTGAYFFAASGSPHYLNPKQPGLGTWYNYTVSQPLNEANLLAAIIRLQGRRGVDGDLLGFEGTHLIVPQALYEQAKLICEVLDIVPQPGLGAAAGGSSSDLNTGGNRSRVYKRLLPVRSLEMPSTMWIVAQSTAGMGDHMQPFGVVLGGQPDVGSEWGNNQQVEIITHTTGSEMYKRTNKVGVSLVRREGVGLITPHCFEVMKTTS